MASEKKPFSMPGVAQGTTVVSIPTDDGLSAEDKVNGLLQGSMASEVFAGWGATLLQSNQVRLVSASDHPRGRAVFSFTVSASECNRLGNLHGGCTATLFDICTTCALAPISRPGFWAFAGVTRTLSVTYLRPIPQGEEVLIECEVVHAGRRLCTLSGTIRRKKDGAVMATCEHGKVSIDPEVTTRL